MIRYPIQGRLSTEIDWCAETVRRLQWLHGENWLAHRESPESKADVQAWNGLGRKAGA